MKISRFTGCVAHQKIIVYTEKLRLGVAARAIIAAGLYHCL
jgi:hypothetical protein